MRGMSAVVAAVMIIALTVGIGAIVINWASGYTRQQISTVSRNTKINCAYVGASFEEDPYVNTTSNEIVVKLLNTGSYDITSTKQTAVWSDDSTTVFNKTISLGVGDYQKVVLSSSDIVSGVSTFSGKSLKRLYIAIDDCEGQFIEW